MNKNYIKIMIGGAIGAIGGFLYWYFIGCTSGACPISSSPVISTIWGALIGGLLFSAFKKTETNK